MRPVWVRVCRDAAQDALLRVSDRPDGEPPVSVQAWGPVCRDAVRPVSAQVFPAAAQDALLRVSGRPVSDRRNAAQVCAEASYHVRGRDAAEPLLHCAASEMPSYRRSAYPLENKERYVYP